MTKVLLVDDDVELTTLLEEYLTEEGYDVATASEGRAAIAAAEAKAADLIVLDVMMPGMNVIEVLRRIRKTSQIPVLMLTARGDDSTGSRVSTSALTTTCRSPARRASLPPVSARSCVGSTSLRPVRQTHRSMPADWCCYPGNRAAEWDGQPLELTGTEFSLLEVLARNAGQLVSKQEISKRAFGQPLAPFDRRIDVHISSVRHKLGLREDGQSQIQSVRGQGYQLLTE